MPPHETFFRRPSVLAAVLILVALNLRGAMTSMGPVLPEIMHDTGLPAAGAGLLTTVPVLCLGVIAPLATRLARRFGAEGTLLLLMLVLAGGCLLRLGGSVGALLASGILVGAPIGMSNVLLPGLVKRDFPNHAALLTGLYTMSLCVAAAVGTGLSVPFALALGGWPAGLAVWALPALVAAVVLLPVARAARRGDTTRHYVVRGLWRDRLAWRVALFFGAQACFMYVLFAWLPPILRDRGMDPVMAGLASSLSSITQMIASLAAPLIAVRGRDQRKAAVLMMLVALVGLLGCLYLPLGWVWVLSGFMGIGTGGMFAVALTIVVLRAPDAHVAAHLSGMCQTVAYLMAAAGPILVGFLHDLAGSWWVMTPVMAGLTLLGMVSGMQAGAARHVGPRAQEVNA